MNRLDLPALEGAGARIYGVGELLRELRQRVETGFPPLLVEGEVTNFSRHASGHAYFTLKDGDCQLRCVLFRTDGLRLDFIPTDGECLVLYGRPTVYGKTGALQMVVTHAFRRGAGKAAEDLERLRRRLEAEGLFRPERKRAIPFHVRSIAVITSRSGAALHDILAVVRKRAPGTDIYLIPVRVQGEGAGREIRDAVELVSEWLAVDVLIVGRGGGSLEDLSAFNDEEVARAVFRCRVPVISAVGHEVNVTICDQVADVRAATPSVAAELAVPDVPLLLRRLDGMTSRLMTSEARGRLRAAARLEDFLGRYGLRAVRHRIADHAQASDELRERLVGVVDRRLAEAAAELREHVGRLEALSPLATLGRGYALVERLPERVLIRDAAQLSPGAEVRLRFSRGEALANVVAVHEDNGRGATRPTGVAGGSRAAARRTGRRP